MRAIEDVFFILGLNIFRLLTIYAAPLSNPKIDWEKGDNLTPVITTDCATNLRCLEVLPLEPVSGDAIIIPEDISETRSQTRRQITNARSDSVLQSWKNSAPILESESRPVLPAKRVSNKMIKKDSLLSHGWGAGGMPFSVLYMTPHGSRLNHGSNTATGTSHQQDVGKTIENPTVQTLVQPNYRVTARNGPSVQSRRQYPIIPQLFISYGWGILGK